MQAKAYTGIWRQERRRRRLLWTLAWLVGGLLLAIGAQGEEVLREPPALYTEQLAPLLTPTEQVLKTDVSSLTANAPGITLLDEDIISVDEAGRRTCAIQVFRRAMTDAGAHGIAEDTFVFRRKEQRFFFIRAETIQPDGTVQPVAANAIIVQSPQRRQQYALYDDEAEVRLIYPNVKPGSTTHAIVVREDLQTRMPGEFSQMFTWTATWPIGQIRYLVDVPSVLDKRLHVDSRGNGVPKPVRENRANHRVRYTAAKSRIEAVRDEVNPAPAAQIGPCLHFSTVADWAAVGRWYGSLLEGRDQLNAALVAQVDGWTKGEPTPDGILRILLTKVSNDVRYTGLELGEADYQPHDCNEVWANQYGDCKDKANLLVAFLRHKGITAHVVLLNTEHAGLIDRRNPDYRVFTHAIVAIPQGKGYAFCDPTIAYALPGMLSPTDADREVFIITDGSGKWERTPAQSAGRLNYRFDLTMKATGELAGWLVLAGDGFYGAAQQDYYQKLDANEARRQLGELLRSYYPGAEVVDVVNQPGPDVKQAYQLKAYFLVPRRLESGAGKQALMFPQTTGLFWSIGYAPERATPFFMYQGTVAVSCTVCLPPGLAPGELPAPFSVPTPAGPIRARWRAEKGSCSMELELETTRSLLSPPDFAGYYGAVQALRAWLDKPVLLSASASPAAPAANVAAEDFPLMPTGAGQLALLDKRFPPGGNPAPRRAALEKTLQYFPSDKSTVFQAGVYLSELDWDAGRKQDAALRLQLLVAAYKSELPPNMHAFGEMVYGTYLHQLERDAEAQEIFVRIANAPGVDEQWRAKAALAAADILKKAAPDKALELLEAAGAMPSPVRPDVYALMAYILLQQDKAAAVRQRLDEMIGAHPTEAEDFLCRVARASGEWTAPGDDALQQALLALLEAAAPQKSQALTHAMAAAKAHRESGQVCARLQAKLKDALATAPLSGWYAPDDDQTLKTDEEFDLEIKAAQQSGKPERFLQLSVQALVTLPADGSFPRRLVRAALGGDWGERQAGRALDQPIYLLVLDCCEALSPEEEFHHWGRLLRALHLARKGEQAGAQAIYRSMLESPGLTEGLKPAVYGNLGASLEQTGDFEPALEAYAGLEKSPSVSPEGAAWMLRAAFINLHLGRTAPAEHILQLLDATDEATLRRTEGAGQLRELIALHRSGKAGEFWSRREHWWMQWEALARKMGVSASGPETVVPVIASPNDWGVALAGAIKGNDRQLFFQELGTAISAARWLPNISIDVASLLGLVQRIAPEATEDYRHLVIGILEQAQGVYSTPEASWIGPYLLAAHYFDDGRSELSVEICAKLNKLPQSNGDLRRGMHRVWGLAACATGRNMEESAAALNMDLDDWEMAADRANLVFALDSLYRRLGRRKEEEWLLKRELTNPAIQKDNAGRRMLAEQYRKFGDPSELVPQPDKKPADAGPTRNPGGRDLVVNTMHISNLDPKDIGKIGGEDRTAVLMVRRAPTYTPEMAKKHLHGEVVVVAAVDARGAVTEARVIGKPDAELAAAAVAAVSKWEFDPARKDGQKVSSLVQVNLKF